MNLSVRQRRSLAKLFGDVERIVELYWDTNNGQELSQSLESVRLAFGGLECVPRPSPRSASFPRLIIEAQCAICGPLHDQVEGLSPVRHALRHSSMVGHVVILNGTTDLPEDPAGAKTCDNSENVNSEHLDAPAGRNC